MAARAWVADVAKRDAYDLAVRLGYRTCPACGYVPQGERDRPGRLGSVRFDGALWFCRACKTGGTPVNLLACAVLGRAKPLGGADWRRVESGARAIYSGLPLGVVVGPFKAAPKRDRVWEDAEKAIAMQLAEEAAEAIGDPYPFRDLYPRALDYVRSGGVRAAPLVAEEYARMKADRHSWDVIGPILREIIAEQGDFTEEEWEAFDPNQ